MAVGVEAHEGKQNVRLSIQNNLYFGPDSSNDTVRIVLGDSVSQREEADRLNAERLRLEALHQRSRAEYGGSAGGYGEAEKLYEDQTNDCVTWVKQQKGIPKSQSIGNGARGAINSYTPQVGAIGAERGRVHAVLVVAINGDEVTINESNFYSGWITKRVLHRSDFIGYIV